MIFLVDYNSIQRYYLIIMSKSKKESLNEKKERKKGKGSDD
jgi:hypothetical protein